MHWEGNGIRLSFNYPEVCDYETGLQMILFSSNCINYMSNFVKDRFPVGSTEDVVPAPELLHVIRVADGDIDYPVVRTKENIVAGSKDRYLRLSINHLPHGGGGYHTGYGGGNIYTTHILICELPG
jgi:hypothetical protein